MMNKKYDDLYNLLKDDAEARSYYNSLPQYVRETIAERADNVNSMSSLRDYAQNLTRGDN